MLQYKFLYYIQHLINVLPFYSFNQSKSLRNWIDINDHSKGSYVYESQFHCLSLKKEEFLYICIQFFYNDKFDVKINSKYLFFISTTICKNKRSNLQL